jgi:hypothetical protein
VSGAVVWAGRVAVRRGAAKLLTGAVMGWAALLPAGHADAADDAVKAFGKVSVTTHSVPADVIQRYAQHQPSAPVKGESTLTNALLADTVNWAAPPLAVETTGNPYVISLRVRGQVLQDGDASSLWQAGWAEDGVERSLIVPGAARTGAKAGDTFDVQVASAPVQFKEGHAAMVPVLSFVRAGNLRIDAVEVTVWSGLPKTSWREWLLPFQGAGVGLVMLVLLWWWRRR